MNKVALKNVSLSYRTKTSVLNTLCDISFGIKEYEFVAILGPNGCGKSTLLSVLLGIASKDCGTVEIAPNTRIGFVFQNFRDSLVPWRNVLDNVLLPLEPSKLTRDQMSKKARTVLAELGLTKFESAYIYELSGGMAQLVALARALVTDPDLLLLDEPFSALDYQRTLVMQDLLARICRKRKITTLLISHDPEEAVYLADRIIIMSNRPSHIKRELKITLPRPRSFNTRLLPQFTRYHKQLLSIIKSNEIAF